MPPAAMIAVALVAGAYLVGSIPFGLLLGRRRGVDVRAVGSGNIGAANVARSLGKKLGAVVLVLDLCKGAGPMLALRWLMPQPYPYLLTAVGVAAIAGHCWSPWLRFRGGKGVATSLGVFLTMAPGACAIAAALFALIYALTRWVSLGSMLAAITVAGLLWAFDHPGPEVALGCAGALIIVFQHRQNIVRLWHRQELRL
ncbi:glycerol-3-phosphate 1-O-acyltransferase PlsY [Haliangium sp.]|uniref:glycerol-3-phosphate 1-O-acyltransferase PlsY n=1 Tax=Haliangium sp. TaxID=2663208 RepID=UPI003D0DA895